MKKTIIERMLILWQDQVAAEAHAEAVALAVVHSVAALAVAVASAVDPLAVLTVAASVAHITEAALEALTADISEDTITITAHSSGVPDAVYM